MPYDVKKAVHRETLTSRERVIRTLRRQPVDRVPIDLGSHMSTGISAFAYWHLRQHLGLPVDDIWIPDLVQFLAYVDEDVRQRFHVDCVLLQPRWPAVTTWSPRMPYRFQVPAHFQPQLDSAGDWIARQNELRMRMPANGFFFDGSWLSNWGAVGDEAALDVFAAEAERIYRETPYATNFVGYGYGLGFGAFFGDFDRLVQMMDDPATVQEEHRVRCDEMIVRAGRIIDRMGGYIQLLTVSDDMGTQNGPMCRPSLVEECVAPYLKRFCDFIHRHSDIRIFMHNCGAIKPLIPILIDCGVDVLNPVQISADHMDPRALKREFGERIVFWGGGCDTQNILGRATPQEVATHVRDVVKIFKTGGGFVFNQVHNILGNVPPENIVALFDAAYEASFYNACKD